MRTPIKLLELSDEIEKNINVDLYDFPLSDIIDFDTMIGSVSDEEGEEIIYFKVLTPKENIEYYVKNYTSDYTSVYNENIVNDLDIEVIKIEEEEL